jgi:F-type H+-transporting ATPase subunit epsilon
MRLRVATPNAVVLDVSDVRHVRAEDETGAFGIQPGHADFVTPLVLSVISFRCADGQEQHVAVRAGVLRVRAGSSVEVATREAVVGDDLDRLQHAVLTRFRARSEQDAKARTRAAQLNVAVVRHLYRYVRASRDGQAPALAADALEEP